MAKNLYGAPTGIPKSATPNNKTLAPSPSFPERVGTTYEGKGATPTPGRQGPARFYEGVASDTDVPKEFTNGAMQGYKTADGRPNHNENVYEKWPAETMKERAHMGSAAWPEAPTFVNEFSGGADTVNSERKYQMVTRGTGLGKRWERISPAEVRD